MTEQTNTYGRGELLRIDLGDEKITKESIPPELIRKYLGGEGINDWLLWQHFLKIDPGIDPLDPQNILVAGTGVLAGTSFGVGGKMKWTFKSPAYNMFGDSSNGGRFVSSLRMAGYDHLVITGKADRPVYIWIDDDTVEIRDAADLWGKDTHIADDLIKQALGDSNIETALIGIGAENLVRYSSIIVSRHRAAGRTGAGTVMASKNLKGIAVRGTKGIRIYDPRALFEATDELIAALNKFPRAVDGWRRFGTLTGTSWYQRIGVNAVRNNQYGMLPSEKYQLLDHRWYTNNLAVAALSCPGCSTGCSGIWRIKGDESPSARLYAGESGSKVEYLGLAAWGLMCDITDWPAVCHFWLKCQRYGIDVVEVGACCALLMELWQRGIITERDTSEWLGEPISLEWGSVEAVEKIIDAIGSQNCELGRILGGGVHKAAQMIQELKGVPVLKYALYGKGGAAFMEDVRNTPSWATNMAVASRGADHLKGMGTLDKMNRPDVSQLYFGRPEGAEPFTTTLKGASSALAENRTALISCLGLCLFLIAADPITYPNDIFARILYATTGVEMSAEELRLAGERTVNLEKAFNSRLGLRRENDIICERWMKEPMVEGVGKGWKAEDYIEQTKDEYYEWHGWDKVSSLQTRRKLEELEMGDVAEVLARENALA